MKGFVVVELKCIVIVDAAYCNDRRCIFIGDIDVVLDSVMRFDEIIVGEKSRIQKGNRDTATSEFFIGDIDVVFDSIMRFDEIIVREKSRIQKSNGDAASSEFFIGSDALRSRQNIIGSVVENFIAGLSTPICLMK